MGISPNMNLTELKFDCQKQYLNLIKPIHAIVYVIMTLEPHECHFFKEKTQCN